MLLHLDSSADLEHSRSRTITAAFADAWSARGADHEIVVHDLFLDPPPHLAHPGLHWAPRLRGGLVPPAEAEAAQRRILDELLAADVVLIGAPMYNYAVPSTLKAWIDHIHVPGVTAPFDTDTQPLKGRPCVIAASRGGVYDAGTATESWDHEIPSLRLILENALGMDVHVLTASRTLADFLAPLAAERPAADAEFAAAVAAARRLAAALP